MNSYILDALKDSQKTVQKFLEEKSNILLLEKATEVMIQTINQDGRILSCGNGGSMCDAMHFAEELTGRYRKDRPPIAALSMGDPSHITCVANDYGFDKIFSRNIEAWGKKGDTLLTISTSGNSENCIQAAKMAKEKGMHTVALLGKGGGKLKELVDIPIIVDHSVADRIQEIHIKIIHIFIEGIERSFYPHHYL